MRKVRTLIKLAVLSAVFAMAGQGAAQSNETKPAAVALTRNLFAEDGRAKADVETRLNSGFQQLFHGDPMEEAVYFSAGANSNGPLAYIFDVNSGDVRSEGMSYGMMISAQLGKKAEFDALWNWSKTFMQQNAAKHPARGYFAWSMKTNGVPNDDMPAPDGEEYYATALLFAAGRWGNGQGIYNYMAEADKILDAMRHREIITGPTIRGERTAGAMFQPEFKQVRFTPVVGSGDHTDPSYHLPAFYEVWARYGPEQDRDFWKGAAAASRDYFQRTANAQTGLTPDYSEFDGMPCGPAWNQKATNFIADAWRTAMNWSVDWTWWRADPREQGLSARLLAFFKTQGMDNYGHQFTLDGKPINATHAAGLVAMNAVAALAVDSEAGKPFVEALWNLQIPRGHYRYYDGMLYMLAMLHCSGEFRVWPPSPSTNSPARRNGTGFGNDPATQADYQKMLQLLGIKSIRPGREGSNTKSPNFANYNESKANPFPNLPDALTLKNGEKVTSSEMWWNKRRPEIVEDFDREIYGRVPTSTPRVKWEVVSTLHETNGGVAAMTRELLGHVDNSECTNIVVDIQLTLSTPEASTRPVPVILQLGFKFGGASRPSGQSGPTWQQQCLARGWGWAALNPVSVQADNGAGLCKGIIGLCNKGQPRAADDWGALRAWAWGASRALDYFEKDRAVDTAHVGIEGHSRYGKAALVAMAYEPRFAAVYVSSSGEGGAKLHRRDWGEIVENVAGSGEYHWMAGNFIKYAGPLHWTDLPVDSHEIIALCAPRAVFLSTGKLEKGDGWCDPKGTFLAGVAAAPVYTLLGRKPFAEKEFPPTETLCDGDLAFRQHSGGHTDAPNWPAFLEFAARHFKSAETN